jgi:hypothetical protein
VETDKALSRGFVEQLSKSENGHMVQFVKVGKAVICIAGAYGTIYRYRPV